MTLKNASGVSESEAELLTDRLRIELFNTGSFGVMERGQMQEILKEQGFQQSGACTDEGCMVEMGQLLGVQQLIGGSIGRLGSMFLINIRCINVTTARIEAVVSEDINGSIEQVVGVLPRIAARLGGGQTPATATTVVVSQEKTGAVPVAEQSEEPEQTESAPPTPPAPKTCDSKVFLEQPAFTAQQLGFGLSAEEMASLNKEIAEELEEPFDECLYDDVEIATREQLAQMPECRAIVIRINLRRYSVEPSSDQFKGTAAVAFAFYDGTEAVQPFHVEEYEETGARHWGEYEPFKNAFEEIADSIEDDDYDPFMRDLRNRIRQM